MSKRSYWVGLVLSLVLGGSRAWGVLPVDQRAYEVPLPLEMVSPMYQQLSQDEAQKALPGWSAFQSVRGQGWMVAQYRTQLQSPAALIGPGIPLVEARADQATVERAAREFVGQNAAMLKVDPTQLGPSEWMEDSGLRQVMFIQNYQGLEVLGGRAEVYVVDGKISMLCSEFYPGIDLSTTPALDGKGAELAATAEMPFNPMTDSFTSDPRLLIYPMIQGGRISYYLAYEVRFTTQSPLGDWWAYVDASDGQILTRRNDLSTFAIPVTVTSDIQPNYAQDPYSNIPSADHRVSQGASLFYTDSNGFVNVTVPDGGSYNVQSQILGRYSNVNNSAGGDAAFSGSGSDGVPLPINWTDANSTVGERDGFYSANRVHAWIKSIDPAFTQMDFALPTNVNIADAQGCNAFWNGSSINFYAAAGNCVNMAQISDVVMHEYGHGITQYTYSPQGPPTSSGMGEGFSDIIGQTITNDRYMGRGIYNGNGYIRDAMNLRQYPGTSCSGEVHCLGEIIMGAMWKTRTNLINTYGYTAGKDKYDHIFRTAHKTKQTTMPNFLTRLLLADDDNGSLADGTPDWYDICDAFALHNLPCPAITSYISFTHTPVADQTGSSNPYEVISLIQAINSGTLVADSLRIFYSTNQGQTWANTLLTPTGNLNEYHGFIPAQPCGTLIDYYLRARSSTGATGTEPLRAPRMGTHEFMIGTPLSGFDNYENDTGWTAGAPGDAATQGLWERALTEGKTDPYNSEIVQPYTDHTPDPGTLCFVTDHTGGYYLNYDVDGGATTVRSPLYNWSAVTTGVGKLDFWAFFANELVIDDTLRASVSNDGGNTWLDLVKIYGSGKNDWLHYTAYFTSQQLPFTNQMRVRFQIADYNASLCEGAVDDVTISYTNCTGVGVEAATVLPARFEVEQNQPNPVHGSTSIRFGLPSAAPVSIEVFDVGGRLVRHLARGPMAAGYHSVTWDGRDEQGRDVSAGLYYYRVSAGDLSRAQRMILVK